MLMIHVVFNYWEPTHYLSHGYGLQTWEYSPAYAIRSWAYIVLHALFSRVFSELPKLSKVDLSGPIEKSKLLRSRSNRFTSFTGYDACFLVSVPSAKLDSMLQCQVISVGGLEFYI
jgi:hypothetical protein